MTPMPPENLIKASTWKEDMAAGKVWNRKHDHPWTMHNRASTCWASEEEADPWISLKFNQSETVYKVAIGGLHKWGLATEYPATETLKGAELWVGRDGVPVKKCS